LIYTLDQDNIR